MSERRHVDAMNEDVLGMYEIFFVYNFVEKFISCYKFNGDYVHIINEK